MWFLCFRLVCQFRLPEYMNSVLFFLCVCSSRYWSQRKTARPLSATSTLGPSSWELKEPGSLWTSQKQSKTGCQIQVSFMPLMMQTSVCMVHLHVFFYCVLLQKTISAWSWASTVPAAPLSHPPTTLSLTRARSWRRCSLVRSHVFASD